MRVSCARAAQALSLVLMLVACDSGTSGGGADGKDAGGSGGANGGANGGNSDANNGNGASDAGNSAGMDSSLPPAGMGSVSGFVYDTSSPPAALAGVTITGPGGESAVSDATGAYTLKGVAAAEEVTLLATVDSYTVGVRNVGVLKDQKSFVSFFLKQTYKGSVDAAKGGLVRSPEGAAVRFKAGSLVKKKDGSSAEGKVNVELTPIDPTRSAEFKAFPGSSQAKNAENKSGVLDTHAPMEVKAKDDAGDDLQVKQNESATYEFPIPAGLANVPAEIDVWSLDETTGVWAFEAKAKKGKNEQGQDIYTAEAKHMSWWTCDTFIDSVTCVRGCVKSAGQPVVGSIVTLTGVGLRFRATDSTDEEGCFYANLPQDSAVSVFAADATGFSTAVTITTDKQSKRWEDGKSACQEVADLTLVAAPAGSTCPAGYTECDGSCRDLQNDSNACGMTCETAAACSGRDDEGPPPVGPQNSICQQGECACPTGFLTCPYVEGQGEYCVNSLRDRQQCGTTCETLRSCEANELCVNGACTVLTCVEPAALCTTAFYVDPYCSNLNTDANNCGACGTRCGSRGDRIGDDDGFVCQAGVCGCEADLTTCGYTLPPVSTNSYTCEDITSDPGNCGGCYALPEVVNEARQCADDQACVGSACTDLSCGAGQAACAHACIDILTNNDNCGECGLSCSGGTSCVGGSCVCPANQILCLDTQQQLLSCVDTSSDETHCGGCTSAGGVSCEVGNACVAGKCAPIVCQNNLTLCGNDCVDLTSDEGNCQDCGVYCPGTCGASGCDCGPGQQLCCQGAGPYCTADTGGCFCGE